MAKTTLWDIKRGDMPVLATAIHDGHSIREEALPLLAIPDAERLREEDPFTGLWTGISDTRIVVKRSRFGIDLNRVRDKAVYIEPADAWNLRIWKTKPSDDIVRRSLAEYDAFYAELRTILEFLQNKHGRFVVLDIHSYNHRRDGAQAPPANPEDNPEVNVGTRTLDKKRWGSAVDRFMKDLSAFDFLGRHLDVRENIRFRGGYMSEWIHKTFPGSACVLAIEFKKFFMDEWTGKRFPKESDAIGKALASAVPGLLEELQKR